MNLYKEYRFYNCVLISGTSGKCYKTRIPKGDRFYEYMRKHITAEKVEGQTKVMIDNVVVEDPDKTFFDDIAFSFTLKTEMFVKDYADVVSSYSMMIERVELNSINVSGRAYRNSTWTLTLFELQIPYHTRFHIEENTDESV